jgi:hypothetical protein
MQLDMKDDDIIIISDVDEIPNLEYKNLNKLVPDEDFITCTQIWFNWNFNWVFNDIYWPGSQLTKWKYLKSTTPQNIRNQRYDIKKLIYNKPWGWHLSWFGNNDIIIDKLKSFAHQEIKGITETMIETKRLTGDAMVSTKLVKFTGDNLPKHKDILEKKHLEKIIIDFE